MAKMTRTNQPLHFASAGVSKSNSLMAEIATRARSIDFFFFGGYLPNPDPILKKMGKDQHVYEDILGDGHLTGIIAARTSGVKKLEWAVDRGKAESRAGKAIKGAFELIDMDRMITEVLEANYRGYQPLEVLWGKPNGDGLILPMDVMGKPPEWFQFDELNQLKFRSTVSLVGEDIFPRKILLPRRKPTYKNPYGDALLSKCYWPAVFKRSGLKFWVTFVEKYGIPFAVGKLPRGQGEAEYKKLAEQLEQMVQDAVAAIPDDTSIELIEQKGRGTSGEIFQNLVAWADAEMSKAVIGHAGGADSTPGKLGGEDNAQDVKSFLVQEDKRLVENTVNQLVRWICEINFATDDVPKFTMFEEEDIDLDQATRDKSLSDQGVEFSKEYYERVYGFEPGDIVSVKKAAPPAPPMPGKPPVTFSERPKGLDQDQAALADFIDGLQAKDLQAQAEGLLKPVIDMIEAGTSYQDILDKLDATYKDMDSKSLEKMLHRSIYVSEMLGRANANS